MLRIAPRKGTGCPRSLEGELTLGERMKAALGRAGMSAEGMGRALDVTGAAVRQWTRGQNEPDVATLLRFSQVAGCSLLWLVEGEAAPAELSEWAVHFADLVASGVDPAAALASVSGGAASLSAPEAARLSAAAEGMRALLDELSPAPWRDLSLAEKRQVLALIDRLSREKRTRRPSRRRR
jgi:transcriptional regulator with XRE-family HTH domain